MNFLLVLVEIITVNKDCDMNRKTEGNAFTVCHKNPQAIKRALKKVMVLAILYVLT